MTKKQISRKRGKNSSDNQQETKTVPESKNAPRKPGKGAVSAGPLDTRTNKVSPPLPKNDNKVTPRQGNDCTDQILWDVLCRGGGGVHCPDLKQPLDILKEMHETWSQEKAIIKSGGRTFSEFNAYEAILSILLKTQKNMEESCEQLKKPLLYRNSWQEYSAAIDFNEKHRKPFTPEECAAMARKDGLHSKNTTYSPMFVSSEVFCEFIDSGPGLLELLNVEAGEYEKVQRRCAKTVQDWLDKSIWFLESPKALAIDTKVPDGKRRANKAENKKGRTGLWGSEKSLARRIFMARKEEETYDFITTRFQDELEDVYREKNELKPGDTVLFDKLRKEAKRLRDDARKWPEMRSKDPEK